MSGTFNAQSKIFYRPIDAALRWCNLYRYEAAITRLLGLIRRSYLSYSLDCPVYAPIEKIYDSIHNGVNRSGFARKLARSFQHQMIDGC